MTNRKDLSDKKVILIIDDDIQFRRMLKMMFERAGYDVLEASNGREGIQVYGEAPVDLIITDILMPEKDGIDTMMELVIKYVDVKFIAISGGCRSYGPDIDLRLAKNLGAVRTLSKPIDRELLLAEVNEILVETPSQGSFPNITPAIKNPNKKLF